MLEETAHQRPCFSRVAAFKKCGRLYAAIKNVRFLGPARGDLPDILQRDARLGGKSNRRLPGIGPAFSEIIAGTEQRPPVALRRSPYAIPSAACVISHGVDIVSVKIGTADIPAAALAIGAKNERSFCRSHQQKKISPLNLGVPQ